MWAVLGSYCQPQQNEEAGLVVKVQMCIHSASIYSLPVLCPESVRGQPEVSQTVLGRLEISEGLKLGKDSTYYWAENKVDWIWSPPLSKRYSEMSGIALVNAGADGLLALPSEPHGLDQ